MTSHPFTLVPLWDPRSFSSQPSGPRTSSACRRDTDKSVRYRSQSRVRPMVKRSPRPDGKENDPDEALGPADPLNGPDPWPRPDPRYWAARTPEPPGFRRPVRGTPIPADAHWPAGGSWRPEICWLACARAAYEPRLSP